jgi:tripartite-type tricarboxylate transporter receptor subunit TctC
MGYRKAAAYLAAAVAASGLPMDASAQKFPTKPMRMVSAFAPGGGTDILARAIAVPVAEAMGQPVVVDNRPGAGGTIGSEFVARAAPDGYTIIMVASTYTATAAYDPPSYDPVTGIEPIILIGTTGLVMSVHPSIPARSVKELIDYARSNPRKLNYASVGTGSVPHFAQELFRLQTRIDIVHVPYKGGGPAVLAAVGGEVQMTTISMVAILPHIKAGRLRALAITTPARASLMPDLPTIGETVPGFEVIHWYGIWGPKGMPKPIVSRWNQEVAKVLRTDEAKNRSRAEGMDPAGGPPEEFRETIRRDVEKWRKVVREAKIKRET